MDGDSSIFVGEIERYRLFIYDGNSTEPDGNSIMGESVKLVRIETLDPSKVKFIETSIYRTEYESEVEYLEFKSIEDVDLYVKGGDISGVADIKIEIEYIDSDGQLHTIVERGSIDVLSSDPTALSITSAGVEYEPESRWFKQRFLISATDRYGNIVGGSHKIRVSTMADFRDRDGRGREILFGEESGIERELIADFLLNQIRRQFF